LETSRTPNLLPAETLRIQGWDFRTSHKALLGHMIDCDALRFERFEVIGPTRCSRIEADSHE